MFRDFGSSYSPSAVSSADVEGRVSAGFSVAPNDIRCYVGNKVVISNTGNVGMFTYTSGS